MVDYKSNATNLYFTAIYNHNTSFNIFGTVSFTQSKAEMDQVIMPDVTPEVATALSHQDFTFDNMHEYTNIEYALLGLHAGFEYLLPNGWTFTLDGKYYDLTDDQGSIYGDESGSFYIIRSGIRFSL